jgi:hypothetical protein
MPATPYNIWRTIQDAKETIEARTCAETTTNSGRR